MTAAVKVTPKPETEASPDVEPITYQPPSVTIEGETYPLRRLQLQDVFSVSRILGSGVAVLGNLGKPGATVNPGQILQVVVASLSANQEPVLNLMASLIGVTRRELDDPERFGMDSIITLGEALAEHQDLARFLAAVDRLGQKTPEMQTRSGASST